jgi:integrin beta 3
MEGIAPVLRGYVERAFEPIGARLAAVEGQLKNLPAPQVDVDPVMILRLVQEEVAKIPPAPAGRDADPVVVASLIADEVAKLPPAAPGKDADLALVADLIERAIAALPPAKDGEPGSDGASVTVEDLAPMIAAEVAKAVTALPTPEAGKDADPAVVERMVLSAVSEAIAALPPAKDGEPGPAGDSVTVEQLGPLIADEVAKAVDRLPTPAPGKDADPELVERMVTEAVQDAVAALPTARDGKDGRDGVGVAGAVIDRAGELTLTLSDGTTKSLGVIVGKDGTAGADGKDGNPGLPGRDGKDGVDGLGFDDMSVDHDGERGFVLRFARGDVKKEFPFTIPIVIDRGVWRDGQYQKGDGATWGGSFFIAQRDTTDKPETSDAWRLSVKRGRDGKDGKPGDRGPEGQQGKAGRDLTQVGPDGGKW